MARGNKKQRLKRKGNQGVGQNEGGQSDKSAEPKVMVRDLQDFFTNEQHIECFVIPKHPGCIKLAKEEEEEMKKKWLKTIGFAKRRKMNWLLSHEKINEKRATFVAKYLQDVSTKRKMTVQNKKKSKLLQNYVSPSVFIREAGEVVGYEEVMDIARQNVRKNK